MAVTPAERAAALDTAIKERDWALGLLQELTTLMESYHEMSGIRNVAKPYATAEIALVSEARALLARLK